MSAQYMGDVCTITGKYTDQQGNEKNRYMKVGTWFDNEGRISVKLEAIPLPDEKGNVWMSLFLRQQNNNQQQNNNNNNNNQRRSRY